MIGGLGYRLMHDSTPLDRIYEAMRIGQWDKWVRVFVNNLVWAAALQQAHDEGYLEGGLDVLDSHD